jgi:hypothetical protein
MIKEINIKSILLLLRRYFLENVYREIMFWSVIALLFTVLDQRDFVIMIMYIGSLVFSNHLYKELWNGHIGTHFLMIPATHLDKLITAIILNTVYYFIMMIISYVIGNLLIIFIYHTLLQIPIPVNWDLFIASYTYFDNGIMQVSQSNEFWRIFGTFATIQAFIMLGSLYFNRSYTLKTFFSLMTLFLVLLAIQIVFFKTIWDVKHISNAIYPVFIMINDSTIPLAITNSINIASYFLLPFLWVVCYYRLTERQS